MIRILVTGANGQLGSDLRAIAPQYRNIMFTFVDKRRLNILDTEKFEQTLQIYWPHYVINAAAYTNVEKAEDDQRTAFELNSEAVGAMAHICKKNRVRLLHISSDYVYHPDHDALITEDTPPKPKGIYARSKYHGELKILESGASSLIVRTSWLYSSFGNNFVKTMLELGKTKKEVSVIHDQVGAPTYARDLAHALVQMIQKTEAEKIKWSGQIYNYANEGAASWYDFAQLIFAKMDNSNITVLPVSSTDYPSKVPRPKNSRLSLEKTISTWGLTIRPWQDALDDMLAEWSKPKNKSWRP